jgi:hypothetical protein
MEKPGYDTPVFCILAALLAVWAAFRIRTAVYMGIGKAPGVVPGAGENIYHASRS